MHFSAGCITTIAESSFRYTQLELRRPMFAEFTPQFADRYIERFSGGFDGVDFSHYSKMRNPQLQRYNFGFATVLNA